MIRTFLVIILICWLNPAFSQEKVKLNESVLESQKLLKSVCGFELPSKLNKSIFSAETSLVNLNTSEYYTIKFDYKLALTNKLVSGKVYLSCLNAITNTSDMSGSELERSKSIKEIIQNEDSGGRYGRNVLWEKIYVGVGWRGRIAYINMLIGDGEKTPLNTYIICHDDLSKPCVTFEIDEGVNLSKLDKKKILSLLAKVVYINPQKS